MKSEQQHPENIEIALQAINNPEFRESNEFRNWIKSEDNLHLYEELALYRTAIQEDNDAQISENIEWNKFLANRKITTRRKFIKRLWIAASSIAAVIAVLFWSVNKIGEQNFVNYQESVPEFIAKNEPQVITIEADNQAPVVIISEPQQQTEGAPPPKQAYILTENVANLKKENVQTYRISIPRGKSYLMILEDSTEVRLNADSKLTFPVKFAADKREVVLVGEGYFKVKKDSSRPFIVKTKHVTTKVLGTEFNLKAYESEDTEITLVSGKIAVSSKAINQGNEVILSPNECATLGNGEFRVSEIDVRKSVSWVNGLFYFDNETLEDIMKELGRWYNVNIYFESASARNYKFKFWTDRNHSFQQTVEMFNQIGKVSIATYGNNAVIKEN